ncbi:hypothetical protein SAMN06298210_12248 [Prevotellaceae bacterium KH2P17]|nr:hypothetical protein SAMN06298210_12248 [Prevotellaceae bacterium KH2P17]
MPARAKKHAFGTCGGMLLQARSYRSRWPKLSFKSDEAIYQACRSYPSSLTKLSIKPDEAILQAC